MQDRETGRREWSTDDLLAAAIFLAVVLLALLLATCDSDEDRYWYGYRITAEGEILFEGPEEPAEGEEDGADVPDLPGGPDTAPVIPEDEAESGDTARDGGEETEIGFGPECLVTDARLVFGGKADGPLTFPLDGTSPAPHAADRQQTGPSAGPTPPAGPAFAFGSAFEFHADLNGIHGCTSRQIKSGLHAVMDSRNGKVIRGDFESAQPDADTSYQGNTRTGTRTVAGGVIYEGTADRLHWLDTPGIKTLNPQPPPGRFIETRLLLLRSIAYNADGTGGMLCISGHSFVWTHETGQLLAPQAAQTALAGATPFAASIERLANAARILATPAARGGHQGQANPEFRDLGCYPF